MAELNCKIESDFSFEQVDCHWKFNRFFRLTWSKEEGKNLYYGLGTYANILVDSSEVYTEGNYYVYELPLSKFFNIDQETSEPYTESHKAYENLIKARDEDGWITITVSCNGKSKTFNDIYLELPPEHPLKNLKTEPVVNNPGEIKVSWDAGTVADCLANTENNVDFVNGYCVEMFRYAGGSGAGERLRWLQWNADDLAKGNYKLVMTNEEQEEVVVPEGVEATYISHGASSEVYIKNPLKTEFYFTPKTLGILPGDGYKIVVYPYSNYLNFNADGMEALITNQGTALADGKVSKGIVRVMTANGWVEGQVWVYTEKGWVEADGVYAKTTDGWQESI
jgi:hypothetical protein